MVGREVVLQVDKAPAEARRDPARGRGARRSGRPRAPGGARRQLRACAPGRSSASQASTGTVRPSSSRRSRASDAPKRAASSSGSDITGRARARPLDAGVGHIPEDRQRRGLVLEFSLAENLALHDFRHAAERAPRLAPPERLVERARRLIGEFDVRGGGPQTPAPSALGRKPAEGRRRARGRTRSARADRGPAHARVSTSARSSSSTAGSSKSATRVAAVLLVSLELEEILSLSDRILVMYEGEIVGEFGPGVDEEELGIAMLGGAETRRPRHEREGPPAARQPPSASPAAKRRAASGALPTGRRARRAGRHRCCWRSSPAGSSSSSDGSQPALRLPGDLGRHRPQLVLPSAATASACRSPTRRSGSPGHDASSRAPRTSSRH